MNELINKSVEMDKLYHQLKSMNVIGISWYQGKMQVQMLLDDLQRLTSDYKFEDHDIYDDEYRYRAFVEQGNIKVFALVNVDEYKEIMEGLDDNFIRTNR